MKSIISFWKVIFMEFKGWDAKKEQTRLYVNNAFD